MKSSSQGASRKRNAKATPASVGKKTSKNKVVDVELSGDKASRKVTSKAKSAKKATASGKAKAKASAKKSGMGAKKKAAAASKKSTTKKSTTKKAAAKKATTKKASAKKAPAKKANSKKVASKAAAAKKTATKKAAAKKASAAPSKKAKPTRATKESSAKKKVAIAKTKAPAKKVAATKPGAKPAVTSEKGDERELTAEEETLKQNMISPSAASLKPFREAAKRNKALRKAKEKAKGKKTSFLAKPPRKGKKYEMDLRIHTPASEGFFSTGGVDPAPALVRLARVKGLHVIAITDYNSATYVDVLRELAAGTNLSLIPGLDLLCEVGGCDEISIIALFPEDKTSAELFSVLEELNVPEWAQGRSDFVIRKPFASVLEVIERNGGAVIPSRVDKTPFRKLAIPTLVEEFGIHCFDLIHPDVPEFFSSKWPNGGFNFFSFSNASALGQVGSRSVKVKLAEPGFAGLKELISRRVLN